MTGSKKCSTCGELKELSEFYRKKNTKDGYRFQCKSCIKKYSDAHKKRKAEYDKKYREKNKQKLSNKRKEYQKNNKEKIAKQRKDYCSLNKEAKAEYDRKYREKNKKKLSENKKKHYQNNKEIYKKRSKQYREEHKEYYEEYNSKYREENKDQITKQQKEYVKKNRSKINNRLNNRRIVDVNFNIMCKLRSRIVKVVKRSGGERAYKSIELVGMPIAEYREYLKSTMTDDMTWDDFLNGDIHIDHIKPLVYFDLTKPAEQLKAFNWSNTQLLWAKDNLEKGDKLNWKGE